MKKRILSVLLCFSLCLGLASVAFGSGSVAKESGVNNSIIGESMEFVKVIGEDTDLSSITKKSYGAMDKNPWESFSNKFFYNNMNSNQRNFYDALKSSIDDFFYNERDAVGIQVVAASGKLTEYVTNKEGIPFEGMTADEAGDIYMIFQNSNPQYYFLDNSRITSKTSKGGKFYPSVYSQYIKASDRRASNQQFLNTVNSYINDVKNYSNDKVERQRRIHTLLAEKLSYASKNSEDWGPHQSTATAVLTGITVCAGYSELYALLCNAVGIPCICVTSTTHEWNMVQYGDYWYNVDITNDDGGMEPRWKYFNVPGTQSFYEGHIPEVIYSSLKLPKAEYNFGDMPLEIMIKEGTVYRLFNIILGEHFFTAQEKEKNYLLSINGWKDEGIAFVSSTTDTSIPIYRLFDYSTGTHFYTASTKVRDDLVNIKWKYEGIAFYGDPAKTNPVYSLRNPALKGTAGFHFTQSYKEATYLTEKKGFLYLGIGWYACE